MIVPTGARREGPAEPELSVAEGAVLSPAPLPRPLSSFVGRRREIEELKRVLSGARLLTLTGPGGCGKTRLAVEVASEVSSRFPDGIGFVDLAPVQDPATVPETVATGLGLSRQARFEATEMIGEARLLLLLDNAEHLVESVSQLAAELLSRSPNLYILVTSREILNVAGEVSWRVPPMQLPPEDAQPDPAALADYDAVQLVATRAAEHQTSFQLTASNAQLVVAICRRLDGIPLALELAAARIRSLGLAEIATRLNNSFQLLTGGPRTAVDRHRTLRATVDWSYRLLEDSEQRLLRRLALFAGTFDLAAVEAVCSDSELPVDELAEVLHRLADKSLVTVHPRPDGSLRYGLMEAIRQYGQERLLEVGESRLRTMHARHYAALVDRLETGDDLRARVDRLTAEYENVRLALDWAGDEDPDLQVVMISKLDWFWEVRGTVREARQRILAALAKEPTSPTGQARLHMTAASWFRLTGEFETAMAQIEEAVLIVEQLDDPALAARIVNSRGILRVFARDLAGAESDFSQSLEILKGLPPDEGLARSLNNLALLRLELGHPGEALEMVRTAIQVLAQLSHRTVHLPLVHHTHGAALLMLKRAPEARARFMEGLDEAAEYGNYRAAVALLQGLACCAAESGEAECCLELLAAAQNCAHTAGLKEFQAPATPTIEAERMSRAALGDHAANQAWERGLGMDLRAALKRTQGGLGDDPGSPITRRKRDIIQLVAMGLANKEIARRLSISERTVEAHLEQVRNQLGFRNRAQIAAWAVSRGLISNPRIG
jgi:predicted ATPase/DNA-binding CsgD family transcriptional regulator